MATLNNFHTGNAGAQQEGFHPTRAQRLRDVQMNLHNSRAWDLPNLVPIGPIQQAGPPLLSGSRVDPQITEIRGAHVPRYFVPTKPYTRMQQGDTADGRLLYAPAEVLPFTRMWRKLKSPTHTPVQTRLVTDIY